MSHPRTNTTQLAVSPVVIGFSIASGALFAVQVNSNFFWMFKALMGLSTKGALKTLTMVTSIAALVSLPMVIANEQLPHAAIAAQNCTGDVSRCR